MSSKRFYIFLILSTVALAMAFLPLATLLLSAGPREYYSHIILIPFVSLFFFYLKKKEIILHQGYEKKYGSVLLAIGLGFYLFGVNQRGGLSLNDHTTLMTFSSLVFWTGGFILCYGLKAFRLALFPILFLLFIVPIPEFLMNGFIYFLQVGSTEFTHLLFALTGIPFAREGFLFHLPGMSIEVAKQCSGIRSSLALIITSLIAGEIFLKTRWKKWILVLCVIPITIFKNGLRITILSLLGTYVDQRILGSELHRSGGIPFFALALLFMAPILIGLMKTEKKRGK